MKPEQNPDHVPLPTARLTGQPMKQSRPARKQMVTVLRAASVCLMLASTKEDLTRAIDALSRLSDTDLGHAREWLGTTAAIGANIPLEHVDKLLALIESIERVRPRLVAAVSAAKVRNALQGMAAEVTPEDVAKLKMQTEN